MEHVQWVEVEQVQVQQKEAHGAGLLQVLHVHGHHGPLAEEQRPKNKEGKPGKPGKQQARSVNVVSMVQTKASTTSTKSNLHPCHLWEDLCRVDLCHVVDHVPVAALA